MNIRELNNVQAPQFCNCEGCGKKAICYLVGSITPISRQLSHEDWLCAECVAENV